MLDRGWAETFILSAGSDFLKNEINCNLNGKYSSAFVNGIFSLTNNQQHEIRTTINHLKENTKTIQLEEKEKNMTNIEFLDKKYIIKFHSLKSSNINMYSIQNSPILKENIIQNHKVALMLDNKNSSYLFFYENNKYLLNYYRKNFFFQMMFEIDRAPI